MSDATARIREANDDFYRALSTGDLEAMEAVWDHGPEVECVHPGWDRLRGWAAVRSSWSGIFGSQGQVPIEAADVRVVTTGDAAWVDCDEVLRRDHGVHLELVRMLATNVFVLRDGAWRMVVHHASPAPPNQAPPASTS